MHLPHRHLGAVKYSQAITEFTRTIVSIKLLVPTVYSYILFNYCSKQEYEEVQAALIKLAGMTRIIVA